MCSRFFHEFMDFDLQKKEETDKAKKKGRQGPLSPCGDLSGLFEAIAGKHKPQPEASGEVANSGPMVYPLTISERILGDLHGNGKLCNFSWRP